MWTRQARVERIHPPSENLLHYYLGRKQDPVSGHRKKQQQQFTLQISFHLLQPLGVHRNNLRVQQPSVKSDPFSLRAGHVKKTYRELVAQPQYKPIHAYVEEGRMDVATVLESMIFWVLVLLHLRCYGCLYAQRVLGMVDFMCPCQITYM